MIARIVNNAWAYLEQVPPDFNDVIYKHFTVAHPRRRFLDTTMTGWDGQFHRYDATRGRLARPFVSEVQQLCVKYDVPIDVVDERDPINPPKFAVDADLLSTGLEPIVLEAHQIRAAQACMENECGIIGVPTGGGKTEIMAAVTRAYARTTVIICDQRVVIEQIKKRLELRDVSEIGEDGDKLGMFYGGATPDGQTVVVGSIQSLVSPPQSLKVNKPEIYRKRLARARQFQAIVKQAELLMVDECDKCGGNKMYKRLFERYYSGRLKFGFSGTPFDKRKPVEGLMLREYLGGVISTCSRRELEEIGRIIRVSLNVLAYGQYDSQDDKIAYDIAEREFVVESPVLLGLLQSILTRFPDDGTLILVDTCIVEEFGHALEQSIPGSKFIFGKTSPKERREAIAAFERRELKVLIGGKIIKRGLDLKGGVENVIVLGGGKLWSNWDQSIGRAVRLNKRGFARVFCFMCLANKYLYDHAREQLRATLDLGYDARVVVEGMIMTGQQFLKQFKRGARRQFHA